MPQANFFQDLTALQTVDHLLANSFLRVVPPQGAQISVMAVSEGAAIITVQIGRDMVSRNGQLNIKAAGTGPSVLEDIVAEATGLPGDEIFISVTDQAGAAGNEIRVKVKVDDGT